MPTLIDPATPPTHVEALIATWRYLKYDLEQAIMTLRHKKPLPLTQRHDLIAYMEDILDRGKRMERTATTTI